MKYAPERPHEKFRIRDQGLGSEDEAELRLELDERYENKLAMDNRAKESEKTGRERIKEMRIK